MGDNRPDIGKLKKKRRIDDLLTALRHPDLAVRSDAAMALGEVGDREAVASVKAVAAEGTADVKRAGHWDPGEASRATDKTVVMWHLPSGGKLGVVEGHTGMVTALAMTPDG